MPANGLLGLWWGMTLAVWLHVIAYVFICFAHGPWVPFGIDWPKAAELAAERLEDAGAGHNNISSAEELDYAGLIAQPQRIENSEHPALIP